MAIILMGQPSALGLLPDYVWFLLALSTLALGVLYHLALPKPIPDIPYDKKAAKSVLGHMKDMIDFRTANGNRITPWYEQYQRKVGAPLTQFFPGPFTRPILVLTDFWEVQDILLRRSREFGRGPRVTKIFRFTTPEFHVALQQEDLRYKANKGLVRDSMSPTLLEQVSGPRIYNCASDLVALWKFKLSAAGQQPFYAHDDIFGAISDMILASLFAFNSDMGTTRQQLRYLESLDKDLPTDQKDHGLHFPKLPPLPYYTSFELLSDHQSDQTKTPFPLLHHYLAMLFRPELRAVYGIIKQFEVTEIDKALMRLKDNNTKTCTLDYMIMREQEAATSENREPVYHKPGICDGLSGYYLAGHETSATSLSWALKFLSSHADCQARLRDALHRSHATALREGRNPTMEEITGTKVAYLDAVIEETLRHHAPLQPTFRAANADAVVLGCQVPKGTTILMPMTGPSLLAPGFPVPRGLRSASFPKDGGRHAWAAEDVNLFKPERWLRRDDAGEEVYDASAGPMMTFGFGPRQCFGKRLGYLQMQTVLTLLIWNLDFMSLDGVLGSYETVELATIRPKYSYVKLREVRGN
ncbi:cytochrome P450 [Apiospora kogelbergensis]|uniref:cytochrome P450 n=1 Tax=Apiospora kogelbergensis TaxID=1337665 RepID=UPI00312EC0A6